ncbi:uncharacterized protein BKA55DRAFT_575647, partial [Fusarium redolens]
VVRNRVLRLLGVRLGLGLLMVRSRVLVLGLLVVRLGLGLLVVRLGGLGSLVAGVGDVVVGLGDGSGEDTSGEGEKGDSRQLHVGGCLRKRK